MSIFFMLLATTSAVVLCDDYKVIISTEPANGPFLVNREIEFTCHIDPAPPEPVTYSWHAVKEANGATTLRSQSSVNTITYKPQYRDLHVSWFFCKVFLNKTQSGVGRKRLDFHGFVFSYGSPVRCFNIGDTIQLHVSISNDSLARHIRTLTWYHNGTEVTSSSRVTIQSRGRYLTVQNAIIDDAGDYRVEVTSLNGKDHGDSCCDSTWLFFVRNHAVYAPVTFTVRESVLNCCSKCIDSMVEDAPLQYYPLVSKDSSMLLLIQDNETLTNDVSRCPLVRNVLNGFPIDSTLCLNGTTLPSNNRKFNLSYTTNSNNLTKTISFLYNISDEGFYIYLSYTSVINIYSYATESIGGCYYYYSHINQLNIKYVASSQFHYSLRTYKPPFINLSSNHNTETDVEMLFCSAYGGIPDKHNLTLRKEGVTATGNRLEISLNDYGKYRCTIKSLYNNYSATSGITVQNRKAFQLHLLPERRFDIGQCIQWKDKVNNIHSFLVDGIIKMFKTLCNRCTVTLNNLSEYCTTSGNLLIRGVITYTEREGNITARLLVDMLQVWLLTTTEEIRVTLGHQTFKVDPQCPPRVNSASPDLCDRLPMHDQSQQANGGAIGGSFVGGMLLGFLGCIILLCIGIVILKVKNDMGMRQAATESTNTRATATKEPEEVVMGSNTAYETMEVRYQSPSMLTTPHPQPQGQHIEEDAIYE